MRLQSILVAVGATMLLVANVVAAKIVTLTVPLLGEVSFTAGVFPFAVVFLTTDVITERYGRQTAQNAVWTMCAVLVFGWGMIQLSILLPHGGGVPQELFATTLGASLPLVVASVMTALVTQSFDVFLFDEIRQYTGNSLRFIRNIGSTSVSQFIDTAMFTLLAFVVFPHLTTTEPLPLAVVISIILVEYVVKLTLALLDTVPFYLLTMDEYVGTRGVVDE